VSQAAVVHRLGVLPNLSLTVRTMHALARITSAAWAGVRRSCDRRLRRSTYRADLATDLGTIEDGGFRATQGGWECSLALPLDRSVAAGPGAVLRCFPTAPPAEKTCRARSSSAFAPVTITAVALGWSADIFVAVLAVSVSTASPPFSAAGTRTLRRHLSLRTRPTTKPDNHPARNIFIESIELSIPQSVLACGDARRG
jgi:hypothetical protein